MKGRPIFCLQGEAKKVVVGAAGTTGARDLPALSREHACPRRTGQFLSNVSGTCPAGVVSGRRARLGCRIEGKAGHGRNSERVKTMSVGTKKKKTRQRWRRGRKLPPSGEAQNTSGLGRPKTKRGNGEGGLGAVYLGHFVQGEEILRTDRSREHFAEGHKFAGERVVAGDRASFELLQE